MGHGSGAFSCRRDDSAPPILTAQAPRPPRLQPHDPQHLGPGRPSAARAVHHPRVTGTVTLGDLRATPHHVHLAGPQNRVTGSLVFVDSGYLHPESLVTQPPWLTEDGSWLRESRARGDLDSGASEHLADRLDSELLLLGLDVLADQRDGRSSSAAKKADALFRIALALRSSRTSFSSSLIRCAWSAVVPGLRPPSTWAFLTQVRRASGWTPSSSAILRIAPLARAGSASASNARPHGPIAQLIGVLP